MASYMTSTTLIESVKRRENIPAAQVTFETEDFLAFANEEISIGILPSILQFHEEFLVYNQEIALVPGKSTYQIPDRAVGNKIRAMYMRDAAGSLMEMARINPEDLVHYTYSTGQYYYLRNNAVILLPEVDSVATGTIVISYYMRPNQLVDSDRIGVITAIDTVTGLVSVTTVPTHFGVSVPVDFLEVNAAHRSLGIDVSPVSINTTTNEITFDPLDLPEDLSVGDHIAAAGECFIPQIPDDLHVVLAQRVAARCLEALGDQAGLNAANVKIAEIEQRMGNLIDNRTEGHPQKVFNKHSLLRNRFR